MWEKYNNSTANPVSDWVTNKRKHWPLLFSKYWFPVYEKTGLFMTHECEYEMDMWNKPTFSVLYDILEVLILKISVLGNLRTLVFTIVITNGAFTRP